MSARPDTAATAESRRLQCGNRWYVVRRFADGLFAVYDDGGRLLAGWPLTASWPARPLSALSDEDCCVLIRRLTGQAGEAGDRPSASTS